MERSTRVVALPARRRKSNYAPFAHAFMPLMLCPCHIVLTQHADERMVCGSHGLVLSFLHAAGYPRFTQSKLLFDLFCSRRAGDTQVGRAPPAHPRVSVETEHQLDAIGIGVLMAVEPVHIIRGGFEVAMAQTRPDV